MRADLGRTIYVALVDSGDSSRDGRRAGARGRAAWHRTTDVALPLRGLITGAGIGIAQFLLLRGVTARTPIWALVVALGWAIGWMVTRAAGVDLALQWSVFGSSGAVTFQLLTGLALAWMLRRSGDNANRRSQDRPDDCDGIH
jgi:hypothetical protein